MKFGIFDHLDRSGPDAERQYEERLRLIELYEWAGFHAYHVAEHHGTPLGMAPSPGMFLAAVAQRTQRLRFGPLVYLLPLYHPIRLAEEIAMLDQLGQGRLDVGVGRGRSPIELRNFGCDPATTEPIFEETLEILRRALADGKVDFAGDHYTFEDVAVETRPYQKPHPPFWYGIGTLESVDRCLERGFNVVTNAKPPLAAKICARFLAGAAQTKQALLMGISRFIVVADTTGAALALARRAYADWHKSFDHLFALHGMRPVQAWPASFDAMAADGLAIAGSPADVTAALGAQLALTGANYVVGQFVFGDMSAAESRRCIELFASEVIPALEREPSPA
jgi:alkanesulfonate monooxygenase SsuD/methylene tetrahydromethanopterin reductase-like flavin-dependent oxidoreductase (luciferase family)